MYSPSTWVTRFALTNRATRQSGVGFGRPRIAAAPLSNRGIGFRFHVLILRLGDTISHCGWSIGSAAVATTTVRPGSSPSIWRLMNVSDICPMCGVTMASVGVTLR